MALTTASATLTLDNTLSPPQAVVTDTTNYTAQSIDPNLCLGYIKIDVLTASGPVNVYDNIGGATPDITPGAALTNNIAIPLPLDSDGKAIQGDYTLTYVVIYTTIVDPPTTETATFTGTFSYNFTEPEICLDDPLINCAASTLTSTDATAYGAYATTITRTHTIYPDPTLHIPNRVSSTAVLIYNNIGTGNWATEVSSVVTWTFPDGLILKDTIVGCRKFVITCDTSLCKIFCCLKSVLDVWAALKQAGKLTEAERVYELQLKPSFLYAELFLMALNCGKAQDQLDSIFALVKSTSGCNESCCDDGCATLIIPTTSAGTGTVIVDSPDNTVSVTQEIIDGDTYYHLHVDPSTESPNPIVDSAGLPITVTSSVDGVTGQITYHVGYNGTPATQINELDIMGVIEPNGSTWTFTPTYVVAKGANIIDPVVTPHTTYLGSNEPTPPTDSDFVVLHYSGYQVTPGVYTVQANIMSLYPADTVASMKTKLSSLKTMEAEIMYVDPTFASDDFFMRIVSTIDGHPVKFGELLDNTDTPRGLLVRIQVILLTA